MNKQSVKYARNRSNTLVYHKEQKGKGRRRRKSTEDSGIL